MRKFLIVIVCLVVVAGIGFGWYYFYGPCGTLLINQSLDNLKPKMDEYSDALDVASSTPRMSLDGQIAELQRIRRDTADIEVPACMETAKTSLVDAMQSGVDAFIAFMGNEDETYVSLLLELSNEQISNAQKQFRDVGKCAPFCKPEPVDPYKMVVP